jgi:hypothetical protein
MKLLAAMNREFAASNPGDDAFAARLRSYELAARMQVSIPEAGQTHQNVRKSTRQNLPCTFKIDV